MPYTNPNGRIALITLILFIGYSKLYSQSAQDSIGIDSVHFTYQSVYVHSPQRAALFSTLLPGLGQAYNKQYFKIPFIYGGAAAVTFFARTNWVSAQRFKQEYINRDKENMDALDPELSGYPKEQLLKRYYLYKKNFELSLIIGGVLYLLNIADAYVYAHLFRFDLSEDLSMHIQPYFQPAMPMSNEMPKPSLRLQFTF